MNMRHTTDARIMPITAGVDKPFEDDCVREETNKNK